MKIEEKAYIEKIKDDLLNGYNLIDDMFLCWLDIWSYPSVNCGIKDKSMNRLIVIITE